LLLERGIDFPVIALPDLLKNHIALAGNINKQIKPIPQFRQYLKFGYFPYYKEDCEIYADRLLHTVNAVLETDLPAVEPVELVSIRKIKQLLYIIAQKVPFTPNIKDLAAAVEVSRTSLLNFLVMLEKAQLLNLLQQDVSGIRILAKPEKIYLNNTNLSFALEEEKPDVGGKNKGHEQIMGIDNAYLALDNIEYGYANKIPLWLFGFLY
jgi:predicted AAA+ superfamily ATPase